MTPSVRRSGARSTTARGKRVRSNLMIPYVPSFAITAASTTEPPVGAWAYASGDHVCRGNTGAFTANAAVKARNNRTWAVRLRCVEERATRSKVSLPVCWSCNTARTTMPTSRNAEPRNV